MSESKTEIVEQKVIDETALDAIARILVLIAKSIAEKNNENVYEKSNRK